ncbi:hypothetical protein [Paenibacillus sp. TY11]|uniref:hypothetical protein n=1 Tax=Paenibacillus sp. TY11 TaxID=3448633 RepID=UPI00403A77FB
MKDSQVRIRIPIQHAKEHRGASLTEKEGPGSIAAPTQKNKLLQQQPGRRGVLPPDVKPNRRTTAATSAVHTVGTALPVSGAAAHDARDLREVIPFGGVFIK